MMKSIHKYFLVGIALVALTVVLPACRNRSRVSVGTHTVIVARHGIDKKFKVKDEPPVPSFEYAGVGNDGKELRVVIKGDKVVINDGDAGQLRPGDKVFIGDDGVTVNSMDYGESAKYLRDNNSAVNTSSLN